MGTVRSPVPSELRPEQEEVPPASVEHPVVVGGKLTLTLQSDQTLNTANGVRPFNNLFTEPEFEWFANFGQHLSINGLLKAEQVRSVDTNSAFAAEGLFFEQLYVTLSAEPGRVYGGKIHPRFGLAWDAAPGLYGTDFAEDYEIVEKDGIGLAVEIPWLGKHVLSGELFVADTSFLSKSFFSRPRASDPNVLRPSDLKPEDGGVSNTGRLNNYAIALTGGDVPGLDGFSYNIGLALQRGGTIPGEDGADPTTQLNEHDFVAGLQWELPITSRITMTPIFEFARIRNQGGSDVRTNYYTAGLGLELGRGWAAAAYATVRPTRNREDDTRFVDHLAGFSVDYDLGALLKSAVPLLDGLKFTTGYKHERVQAATLNTVGVLLTYEKKF
ncbi:MAG: hypothetical protein U1F33_01745 [Alphaproteobacteria bacterium]